MIENIILQRISIKVTFVKITLQIFNMKIDRRSFNRLMYQLSHAAFWGWVLQGCEHDDLENSQSVFRLISIKGGDRLFTSDIQIIQWEHANVTLVNFELSIDGGNTWETQIWQVDPNIHQVAWTLPKVTSEECTLRVKDVFSNEVLFQSDTFTIKAVRFAVNIADYPELQAINQVKVIDSISMRRVSGTDFVVLSNICTHRVCGLDWKEGENLFVCPCHGSRFSAEGERIDGIAENPLKNYEYEYVSDKDRLYVF